MKIKTILISLLLMCSLFLTACPRKNDLIKGYETNEAIQGHLQTAIQTVGGLYDSKWISYEQKESLAAKLRIVYNGSVAFQKELDSLREIYINQQNLPDKQLNALDIFFNREVVKPFVDFLSELGVLPEKPAQMVLTAIVLLRSAVLTIANLFNTMRGGDSVSATTISKENNLWLPKNTKTKTSMRLKNEATMLLAKLSDNLKNWKTATINQPPQKNILNKTALMSRLI